MLQMTFPQVLNVRPSSLPTEVDEVVDGVVHGQSEDEASQESVAKNVSNCQFEYYEEYC